MNRKILKFLIYITCTYNTTQNVSIIINATCSENDTFRA